MKHSLASRWFVAIATLIFPYWSLAEDPAPPPTGAALIQKFQVGFDSQKAYLRRPLDELAKKYREELTQRKDEFSKTGNAAGTRAATEALDSLAADSPETPSNDIDIEALRRTYVDARGAQLKQLAPKAQAMFADYTEKLKGLIASLVERDLTDDALVIADRAQQLRDWMAAQPPGEAYSNEIVECLLAKGPPALNGVVAWGENDHRQAVPPKLFGVVAVAGGIYHSLALKYDGTVVAWGGNDDGQATVPAGLSGVVAIAAGEKHSLALKADGTVVAWGYNKEKQCEIPKGLAHVKAISSHTWHSLALTDDGHVVAWGRPHHGVLDVPADLSDVVQIRAGGDHNLALKADGTVVAWGSNVNGQALVPPNLPKVISIAAGHYHSLALTADGNVVGWGMNNYGQTRTPRDLSHVSAIAAQGWHSAALTADGKVVVWGFKKQGQTDVPKDLAHTTGIASGTYHILAIAPLKPSAPEPHAP